MRTTALSGGSAVATKRAAITHRALGRTFEIGSPRVGVRRPGAAPPKGATSFASTEPVRQVDTPFVTRHGGHIRRVLCGIERRFPRAPHDTGRSLHVGTPVVGDPALGAERGWEARGTRWTGVSAPAVLHRTRLLETPGRRALHGGVRLGVLNAERLEDTVQRGTPVRLSDPPRGRRVGPPAVRRSGDPRVDPGPR